MQIVVARNGQDRQLWSAVGGNVVAACSQTPLQRTYLTATIHLVRPLTRKLLICLALIAITFAVFGQTLRFGFVNYDDPVYVSENGQIQKGLTWQNVRWAFTHVHSHNWHPLTTMSHMLDCQLFGLRPGAHHFVNVLLHSASAVLLFVALVKMTMSGSVVAERRTEANPAVEDHRYNLWRSAFVAAVFAIHPLRVESVAWISERKDVLSGVFFMLTLLAYVHYTRKPSIGRYLLMALFFVLGLLSKPMLVSVPVVLLLLDYWPLNRAHKSEVILRQKSGAIRPATAGEPSRSRWAIVRGLLAEKIPLLGLAIGSAIATLIAQRGGILEITHLPLSWRVANAASVYLSYIGQLFWPVKLAAMYPHPGRLPISETGLAAALLIGITAVAFVFRRRRPYFITGWLWYLIMLVPVLGLVQVGSQAHADRYTYLSQIGLTIAVVWGITDLLKPIHWSRQMFAIVGPVVVIALGGLAWIQTGYWRDSGRLWSHTLAVTGQNDFAHFGLGKSLLKEHRLDEAIAQFEIVLATHPNDPDANSQMGYALMEKGNIDQAIRHFQQTLKTRPGDPDAQTNVGNLLLKSDRAEEAVEHYRIVVQQDPSSALAHYNLAVGLHRLGQLPEAIAQYKEALAIDPKYPDAEEFLRQAQTEKDESTDSHQP